MRDRLTSLVCLAILMALTADVPLWANRIGGGAYSFLKVGVGARALGMGGAFVSLANDATAPYWNPAGLGMQKKRQIAFMGKGGVGDDKFGRSHFFLSAIYPKSSLPLVNLGGTWALSFITMGVDNIPHTADDGFGGLLRLGSFKDNQWTAALSYGQGIFPPPGQEKPMFYVGGTLRYISHSVTGANNFNGQSASSRGLEVGLIGNVNTIFHRKNEPLLRYFHNVKMGIVFRKNFALKWQESGHEDSERADRVVGLSFEPIFREQLSYTVGMDIHRTASQPLWISFGNEISFKRDDIKILSLRFGLNRFYLYGAGQGLNRSELNRSKEGTLGLGVHIGQTDGTHLLLDVSFVGFIWGNLEENSLRTSVALNF
jgi:hypothetical protein